MDTQPPDSEQPASPPAPPRRRSWLDERVDIQELIGQLISLSGLVYGQLDRRLEIREAVRQQLRKPVPKHQNWMGCFGGLSFFLFMIQAVSGILLTFYYRPTMEGAYESVRFISNNVNLGWLVRNVHRWGADLMMALVLIHMLRIWWIGAYKRPRELNWMVGVVLLALTMGFSFSGYLLPMDQLSYWATTVGTNMAKQVPVIGDWLLAVMRGGEEVTGETLTRFFAAHVIVLPMTISAFMGLHFFIIRRQGISGPL